MYDILLKEKKSYAVLFKESENHHKNVLVNALSLYLVVKAICKSQTQKCSQNETILKFKSSSLISFQF